VRKNIKLIKKTENQSVSNQGYYC